MRVSVWCFLVVILASCRLFQQQTEPLARQERTFAQLSAGEKLQYLRQVLAGQAAVIRATRIERVKSFEDQLTHAVDLGVSPIDTGFKGTKLPHVRWSKVQADSIELLRCKVKNLVTGETFTGDVQTVVDDKGFEEVQKEPNKYGFLSCERVHGKIKNGTTLIDHSAENKFIYTYLFRPCFMNYAMVVPATSSTVEQCGEDSIKAAESTQAEALQAEQIRLVFRYCAKDKQQVCSPVVSRTEEFAYNHGVAELPLELFEQRRAKLAEIAAHENSLYVEGNKALQSAMLDYNAKGFAVAEKVQELEKEHNDANDARIEAEQARNASINQVLDYANILNQNIVKRLAKAGGAKKAGAERNLSYGNDCYQDYKDIESIYEDANENLKSLAADMSTDEPEHASSETENEYEELKMDDYVKGMFIGMCALDVADAGYRIYKDYQNWDLTTGETYLAAANVVIGTLPMENSELNRGGAGNAFQYALAGIFKKEEEYYREHCKECLDHIAKFRHYSLKLFQLKGELSRIEEDIARELTVKGVTDPYETSP